MSDQFLAEIRMVGFNFAPNGWAFCNGQLMPISQNTALFSLLGTSFGGNGNSTFALPNLQGSAPLCAGTGSGGLSPRVVGEIGGQASVSLQTSQLPSHTHTVNAATSGGNDSAAGNVWASGLRGRSPAYAAANVSNVTMNAAALGNTGGGGPHNNMMPYLCVNFVVALQGIFPARN